MATNKKTVSVYADDDLFTALEEFKDSGNHKSLNVAIVAILREKLFGESTDNMQSTLQGKALSTLDVESMINEAIGSHNDAIASRLSTIESNMRSLQLDRMSEKTDSLIIENLLTNLSIAQNQISELSAKIESIENTPSEATAPANFTQALTSESEGSSVPDVAEVSLEPELQPIIEALSNIAAPVTENQLVEVTSESFETIAAPVIQTPLPDETLPDAIAATVNPILSRPDALAIAQNFGFIGKGQNLYDWSKAALTSKSDEAKKANSEKLAAVGLVAAFTPENKPAWIAKMSLNPEPIS